MGYFVSKRVRIAGKMKNNAKNEEYNYLLVGMQENR
jgi:hypothetical protein